MSVFFRVDGNASIGAGHVMRCLSIADAALQAGLTPVFVTAGEEFSASIAAHGFEQMTLTSAYDDMESELASLKLIMDMRHPSAIFVDSYYVTENYLNQLSAAGRDAGSKVVYVDDILAFPYEADYLLNYNVYGPDKEGEYHQLYEASGIKEPKLLLGASYTPLRREFQNLPDRVVKKEVTDILISTGGADVEHMTINLVEAVNDCTLNVLGKGGSDLTFHFVIGAMNEDCNEIHSRADGNPHIVLHEAVTDMAYLMRSCDLAISASGSTLYELCATQTPTVTYILADNQIPGARWFEEHGILDCAGDVRDGSQSELSRNLVMKALELSGNHEELVETSIRMKSVVDGRGAGRVIEAVLE